MATLIEQGDRTRRKLGLGLGEHTVTLTYASIASGDTVTVHGIILTCFTTSPLTELAMFKKETDAGAVADNLEDLIDAIFDSTTGVSAASSAGVVTITGARSVTTNNAAGFAISSSTYQDEPPYTSDIDQWVLDGELDVADKLVNEALLAGDSGLSEVFPLTGDGSSTGIALPSNFLRALEVRAKIGSDSALYWLVRVEPEDMLQIREGRHPVYKVNATDKAFKYWTIYDDKVQFSAAPVVGAAMAEIIGIKTPQTTKAGTDVWTITVTDAQMAANDTITIDGIEMVVKAAATTEVADFIKAGSDNASAQNLDDVIGNIFKSAGVTVSVAANVVTVTGARSIATSKAAAFAISETTAAQSELPSHVQPLAQDYAVIQAYKQMQRYDMASAAQQMYLANIQAMNARYGQEPKD